MTTSPTSNGIGQAMDRSVVQHDRVGRDGAWQGPGYEDIIFFYAEAGDGIPAWGQSIQQRDRLLRDFATREPVLNSAISSLTARNQAFQWRIDGPPRTARYAADLLENANMGRGWSHLIGQVSRDLYAADKGAAIEIIKAADDPEAPTLGIQHLDITHCFHTGDPLIPLIYQDRDGRWHELKWYQVALLAEMPAPHERLHGLQYCGVGRVLRMAQTMRGIAVYLDEKTNGRHTKAIHVLSGVTNQQLKDAITLTQEQANVRGLERYIQPVILGSLDPTAKPSVASIELTTLPDGFELETWMKWYFAVLALGLLVDYQDLGPLPGGNLGTSSQSEILSAKSRGKGSALFRSLIGRALNRAGVLPRNVEFEWDEQDQEEAKNDAETFKLKMDGYKLAIEAGVYTPEAVRQMLVDEGLLDQEIFDQMFGLPDITGSPTGDDTIAEAN